MTNLDSLTTKLAKDKGYSGESPTKDGIRGFVCPRANSYGGREGIIPPAVAVENGLVPRGMKHISVGEIANSANKARDTGVSEAEQYKDYYGSQLAAKEKEEAEKMEAAARIAAAELPDAPEKPERPETKTKRTRTATRPASPRKKSQFDCHEVGVQSIGEPADDPGMFSKQSMPASDDDTLDGFYDGLKGMGFGTENGSDVAEIDKTPAECKMARQVGPVTALVMEELADQNNRFKAEIASLRSELVTLREHRVAGDTVTQELDALKAENEKLQRVIISGAMHSPGGLNVSMAADIYGYKEIVRQQNDTIAKLSQENSDLRAAAEGLDRRLKSLTPEPSETVRVVLSAEEQKIKIGGRHWECNIVGAIHSGRTGKDIVLTVNDPRYSSELLSEIQNGDVVIVTDTGRTTCNYSGNCAKIYGEYADSEFIAMFRFSVKAG